MWQKSGRKIRIKKEEYKTKNKWRNLSRQRFIQTFNSDMTGCLPASEYCLSRQRLSYFRHSHHMSFFHHWAHFWTFRQICALYLSEHVLLAGNTKGTCDIAFSRFYVTSVYLLHLFLGNCSCLSVGQHRKVIEQPWMNYEPWITMLLTINT